MSVFFSGFVSMCLFLTRPRLDAHLLALQISIFRTQLESHIYLDNTLKIRKPEIGIISYEEEGEGGSQREVLLDF